MLPQVPSTFVGFVVTFFWILAAFFAAGFGWYFARYLVSKFK